MFIMVIIARILISGTKHVRHPPVIGTRFRIVSVVLQQSSFCLIVSETFRISLQLVCQLIQLLQILHCHIQVSLQAVCIDQIIVGITQKPFVIHLLQNRDSLQQYGDSFGTHLLHLDLNSTLIDVARSDPSFVSGLQGMFHCLPRKTNGILRPVPVTIGSRYVPIDESDRTVISA